MEGAELQDLKEVRGYPINSTGVVIVWDRPDLHVDVRLYFGSMLIFLQYSIVNVVVGRSLITSVSYVLRFEGV